VLAQQVFFARADIGSGKTTRVNMDAWDGYEATRTRTLDAIEGGGVRNAVVLTGDVHANWANEVRRDVDDPTSRRVATEFVSTSISTGGDGADQRANTARIRSRNPHIKFFNAQRGYLRCRVTPSQWRTDYRVLERVSRYGSGVSTRASFVVEDGRAALERVDMGRPSARTAVSFETETDRIRAEREAAR
jgi:alkaline phosphatase D